MQKLITLEKELHLKKNRTDKNYLNKMLHKDFLEITSYGEKWNKIETINNLISEKDNKVTIKAKEFLIKKIALGLYLMTYKTTITINTISYSSFRTSIWKVSGKDILLYFHQASRK